MQQVTQAGTHARQTARHGRLFRWGALIVSAHLVVVLWHAALLVKLQPGFPGLAIGLLLLVNLLPIAGAFAFSMGANRLAGCAVVIPLATGLVIGGYSHFLSAGTDNVFRMSAGPLTLSFQVSAVLLAVLEALGCWIGLRMFFMRSV